MHAELWDPTVKPPAGAELYPGSAGNERLFDCVPFYEGAGGRCANLPSGKAATATLGPVWRGTPRGAGAYCTGGGSFDVPHREALMSGDFTVRIVFLPVTWPGAFTALVNKDDGSRARELSLYFGTGGDAALWVIGGATTTGITGTTGLTAGKVWDLVITRQGSAGTAYVNGLPKVTFTSIGTGSLATSTKIGREPAGGGGVSADAVYLLYQFWKGVALPAPAVRELASQPYRGFWLPGHPGKTPRPGASATAYAAYFRMLQQHTLGAGA